MDEIVVVPKGTAVLTGKKGSIVYVQRYDVRYGWMTERYTVDEVVFVNVKRKD